MPSHRQRRVVHAGADDRPGRGICHSPGGWPPDWPDLPVQYADYALWQRELLGRDAADHGVLAGQIEYWREALAGLPDELELPFDRQRPAERSQRGGVVRWQLADAGLHGALAELAREHQATVFMVLHAGLAALLSRMGAGTDISLGAPAAGRTDESMHDLVGFFVNTLVLRADLSVDPSFGVLLDGVQETMLAAQARQDVPFEHLVEMLNPVRSASKHPLFQVMIADEDVGAVDWRLPGLRIEAEPVPDVAAKFDLTLGFRQDQDADGAPAGISASLSIRGPVRPGHRRGAGQPADRAITSGRGSPARPVDVAGDPQPRRAAPTAAPVERHRPPGSPGHLAGVFRLRSSRGVEGARGALQIFGVRVAGMPDDLLAVNGEGDGEVVGGEVAVAGGRVAQRQRIRLDGDAMS